MWFRNHYRCERCGHFWTNERPATCDDDCPKCGAGHTSPYHSTDFTIIVQQLATHFVVLRSPDTAEHNPDYREIASFLSEREAREFADSPSADLD